jgi:hypothetical protein
MTPPMPKQLFDYEKLLTEEKVDVVMDLYGLPITDVVADVTKRHTQLMVALAAGTSALWGKGAISSHDPFWRAGASVARR